MQKLDFYIIFFIVLLTIFLIYSSEQLVNYFGNYSYLGIFVLSVLSSASLFVPLAPLQVGVVALSLNLNIFFAAVVAGLGSAIGETTGYVFGKEAKIIFSKNKFIKNLQKLENNFLKKYDYLAILFLSFFPNPIFDFVGIYCGIKRISYLKYLVLTFLGRTIRYLVLIQIGIELAYIF